MTTFIDLHILQDVPPSCINRDDTGTPKSAMYGGVRRLRVSSQAWKRATRMHFIDHLDKSELGTRTKRVVATVAGAIETRRPDLADQANDLAKTVFEAARIKITEPKPKKGQDIPSADLAGESGYLLFLSARQIIRLAELAISHADGAELDRRAVKAVFQSENSVDIALFGRMVADDSDLNVDAACQVAHAISTHAAETEYDFFTAVDDAKASAKDEDAGAGMIGTVEYSSATLYRYATINFDMLRENLGDDEAAVRAVTAFVEGFITSMPTGKQNTFANRTLPGAVVIAVREDQPVSFVGAFEKPVRASTTSGYLEGSVENLVRYSSEVAEMYGTAPIAIFRTGLGILGGALGPLGGSAVRVSAMADALRSVLPGGLVAAP